MNTIAQQYRSTSAGALFAAPFFIINAIVALRIEPLYGFLGSIPFLRSTPIFPLLLLLLFPIGAWVAVRGVPFKNMKSIHVLPVFAATMLLGTFAVLFVALGEDFYRCDVLNIPNCD